MAFELHTRSLCTPQQGTVNGWTLTRTLATCMCSLCSPAAFSVPPSNKESDAGGERGLRAPSADCEQLKVMAHASHVLASHRTSALCHRCTAPQLCTSIPPHLSHVLASHHTSQLVPEANPKMKFNSPGMQGLASWGSVMA